ncbi:MAG: hypothetical protein JNJ55_04715 [Betaproteobacteria bacterium]|nr:hypothetical protein [Betaproteobacteria bacterium]
MYGAPTSPPERKQAAIDLLRHALGPAATGAPSDLAPPLAPQWGRVESMSSLAWMLFDRQGRNAESTRLVAEAMKLRPDWHYLVATLAPALER